MIKHFTLEKKPLLKDQQLVKVDMNCFGSTNSGILVGKIVGKSSEYIIDHWLVEFEKPFSEQYPYKVLAVQHTFIVED